MSSKAMTRVECHEHGKVALLIPKLQIKSGGLSKDLVIRIGIMIRLETHL